jgi:nucleotide-binding universal stress UspA family protein
MKRLILLPTDFSDYANNAMEYAVKLAENLDAQILVLHTYSIVLVNTDVPYPVLEREMEEVKKNAVNNLESVLHKIKKMAPTVETSYILKQGFPAEHIVELAKERDADMIVLGTKGAGAVKSIIFGSNAASVIEKAECPVLAIPENSHYKNIQNIIFASDFLDSDIVVLNKLSTIAKIFLANIILVNVSDEDAAIQKTLADLFVRDLREHVAYPNIDIKLLQGKEILPTLENYVKENRTDMLVMSTRKRNLLEKLIDRSLTKQMAYHADVPLLAFHIKYT